MNKIRDDLFNGSFECIVKFNLSRYSIVLNCREKELKSSETRKHLIHDHLLLLPNFVDKQTLVRNWYPANRYPNSTFYIKYRLVTIVSFGQEHLGIEPGLTHYIAALTGDRDQNVTVLKTQIRKITYDQTMN